MGKSILGSKEQVDFYKILLSLNHQTFSTAQALRHAITKRMKPHWKKFPYDTTIQDIVEMCRKNGWIKSESDKIIFEIKAG